MTKRAPEKATSSSRSKPGGKPAGKGASKPTAASKPTTRGAGKGATSSLAKSAAGAKRPPSAPTAATTPAPKASRPAAPKPPARDEGGLAGSLRALAFALDKKALDPVLLDVRDLCSYCNFQLVLSGRSERQVEAITEGIRIGLRDVEQGIRPLGSEGAKAGQWSLLDYGDFVVHVFAHAVREHYDLEGLWSDAPRIPLDVPADARSAATDAY